MREVPEWFEIRSSSGSASSSPSIADSTTVGGSKLPKERASTNLPVSVLAPTPQINAWTASSVGKKMIQEDALYREKEATDLAEALELVRVLEISEQWGVTSIQEMRGHMVAAHSAIKLHPIPKP